MQFLCFYNHFTLRYKEKEKLIMLKIYFPQIFASFIDFTN